MGIGEMSQQKGHGAPVSPSADKAGRFGTVSYDAAHASRGETPPLPAFRHRLTFAPWRWKREGMTELSLTIEAAKASDEAAIEKLHQRAFGPGRFARTAYRIREQASSAESLAFVARVGSLLVGSVQLTPVRLGEARAFMLGPLTVEPAFEKRGIGAALLQRCEQAALAMRSDAIFLVGDEPYYGRHGYKRVPMGRVSLPGPVDPGRLLVLPLTETGASLSGPLVAAR